MFKLTSPIFTIPVEFASENRPVEPQGKRSDNEIIHALNQHIPITSERNLWGYWHSGIDSIPKWSRRNAIGWVCLLGPE